VLTVRMLLLPLLFNLAEASTKGTLFEECSTGNDLCFTARIEKLNIKVGSIGTDDNVQVEICSDIDRDECCITPSLHSSWTDDWSVNNTEEWEKSYLGKCADKEMKIRNGFTLSVIKDGQSDLIIDTIVVEAVNENCWKVFGFELSCEFRSSDSFECGTFHFSEFTRSTRRIQTNTCHTAGYAFHAIHQVIATIDKDGTDDDVEVEICSDVNNVCCSSLFDHPTTDDWSGSSSEWWNRGDIGECAQSLRYKLMRGPKLTLRKNGRDDLMVKSIEIRTEHEGKVYRYSCGGLELIGECEPEKCIKTTHCSLSEDKPEDLD